jgi:hypothetical protein
MRCEVFIGYLSVLNETGLPSTGETAHGSQQHDFQISRKHMLLLRIRTPKSSPGEVA